MPADELFESVNMLLHGRFGIAQALMRGTRVSGTRTITERWRVDRHVPQPEDSDDVVRIQTVAPYFISIGYVMPLYGTDPLGMEMLQPQNTTPKKGPCQARDFWDLSQEKQTQLRQQGVTWEDWYFLSNNQRLGYFNITGAIASAGLSLNGWSAQEIQQDRVIFSAGPAANDLRADMLATHKFSRDIGGGGQHPGHNDSYRQDSFSPSMQMSFSPDGRSVDIDLDNHNPNPHGGYGLGTILHGIDVMKNRKNKTRTDPSSVAQRYNWECY